MRDVKVFLVNGSPRPHGCTDRALREVISELHTEENVVTRYLWLGEQVLCCMNCRKCKDNDRICGLVDDTLNGASIVSTLQKNILWADAVVFGSPVYYGGISAQLQSALTRLCYSVPHTLEGKVCAGVFSSRRAGSTTAMSQLNLFLLMHSAKVIGSQYWNEVHGDSPNEVELDKEGLQTMRTLARNLMEAVVNDNGIRFGHENKIHTNFISREYLRLLGEENK